MDLVLVETQDLVPMPLGGSTGMGWPGFLHHHPGPVTVGTFCGVPGRIGAFTSFDFFFGKTNHLMEKWALTSLLT